MEEENYSEKSEESSKVSLKTSSTVNNENELHFKFDLSTINKLSERPENEFLYKLDWEQREIEYDSLSAFCPIEVYERKYLRNLQQQKEHQKNEPSSSSKFKSADNTSVSNSLQIPVVCVPNMMEKLPPVNVYTSENMTIIDTDVPVRKLKTDECS